MVLNSDSPCAVPEDVSTIERVDWYVLSHFAYITEERLPITKQHLVLQGECNTLTLKVHLICPKCRFVF